MTTRIENVLAAKDGSVTDENDWEEFALTDVKVRLPGKTRYANILSASAENPLNVTGQLEIVEEDQEHLVLDRKYRSKRVLIENVTHYAYGQHSDGDVGIWVAGEAGWFSVTPAKGYKPMFSQMVEAIDLLYFLADRHQNKGRKKNRWNPKVEFLFQEYSKHTNGACEDTEESAEVFYKHHDFLIKQMVRGKEGVDWQATALYIHLREKFPDVFELHESAAQTSNDDSHSENGSEESVEDAESADEDERAQAKTIFDIVLDMKEMGMLSKRKLNLRSLADTLLNRYEMSSLDTAINLVNARARYIIEMMDDAQESTLDWSRKVIYRELEEATNIQGMESIGASPLHPRQPEKHEASPSSESSEDESPAPKGRKRRARKSLLRPKLTSVSAKGTGKTNRHFEADVTDSDAETDYEQENDETPSKTRGHQLVHDALSTRVNETIRPITSGSATPSADHLTARVTSEIETSSELNNGDDSLQVLHDNGLEPPQDIWICPAIGCGKTVPKPSSKRAKEVIADHSLVHAEDAQTKLNLVLAEQRLNVNAPVNHLIDRIQGFNAIKDSVQDSRAENSSSPSKKIKL